MPHGTRTLTIYLALLAVTASLTPAAQAEQPDKLYYACGVVQNAVGWPLEGIEVRAFGTGPIGRTANINHVAETNQLTAVSNATGVVTLRLLNEPYILLATDPVGPTSPLRGGAAYAPTPNSHANGQPVIDDLCVVDGQKVDGIPLGTNGRISINAPGQAFLAATVTDGLLATDAALEDADVSFTPTLGEDPEEAFHVHTDESGEARLACVSGAVGTTVVVRARMNGYVDAATTVACRAGSTATPVAFALWRAPVTLLATVTNMTDVTDVTPAAAVAPKAGLQVPVPDATIGLASQPEGIVALTPGSTACPTSPALPNAALVADGVSPYICSATTDETGAAILRLPWGGDYVLRAAHAGYADAEQSVSVATGDDADARAISFTLLPREVSVTATVTDAQGAGLQGVAVAFWNEVTETAGSTNATGVVSLPIRAGPYFVNLTAAGYNARQCFVNVAANGALESVAPPHCFRLLGEGNALLNGTLKDKETGVLIAGTQICATSAAPATFCDVTDAQGAYYIEVPPATAVVLNTSAASRWEFFDENDQDSDDFTVAISLTTPAVDAATSSGVSQLARRFITVHLHARNATSGLADVDVNVMRGTKHYTADDSIGNVTGASGTLLLPLRWTIHESVAAFATERYTLQMQHHHGVVHHIAASRNFHILSSNGTQNETLTLDPELPVETSITVIDAHDGAAVLGAQVIATDPTTHDDFDPVSCDPTYCVAPSPATLHLWSGHAWQICAVKEGYDTNTACVVDAAAGMAQTIHLNRTSVMVTVKVVDPHTNLNVWRRAVRAEPIGAFVCDPTAGMGSFTGCAPTTTTGNNGQIILNIPWFEAGEMCLFADAGNGDVVMQTVGPQQGAAETAVQFQPGMRCEGVAADHTGTIELRALRANATTWTGSILAADGTTVAPARVVPTSERSNFVCKPAVHHSATNATPTDCDGVAAPEGTYALRLPMGKLPTHLWSVTGNATAHFNETWTTATTGAAMTFTLWPRAFDAEITITTESSDCGDEGVVGVYLRDLERLRPDTITTAPADSVPAGMILSRYAESQEDGTCLAVIPIPDWNRQAPALPLGAPSWWKETNAYAYEVLYNNHVGYGAFQLGPLERAATIALTHASGNTRDYAAGVIQGSVTDADSDVVTGIPGAVVTAVREEGACFGASDTFTAGTTPAGTYTLPVACPGTYTVSVAHASGLWGAPEDQVHVIEGDALDVLGGPEQLPSATADFPLARTLVAFTVTVKELDREMMVEGALVDPAPQPAGTDPAAVATGADGKASFLLPWGVYSIMITPPESHEMLTPGFVVPVMPGGPNQIDAYAFKP